MSWELIPEPCPVIDASGCCVWRVGVRYWDCPGVQGLLTAPVIAPAWRAADSLTEFPGVLRVVSLEVHAWGPALGGQVRWMDVRGLVLFQFSSGWLISVSPGCVPVCVQPCGIEERGSCPLDLLGMASSKHSRHLEWKWLGCCAVPAGCSTTVPPC